jgi:hypothetical protein
MNKAKEVPQEPIKDLEYYKHLFEQVDEANVKYQKQVIEAREGCNTLTDKLREKEKEIDSLKEEIKFLREISLALSRKDSKQDYPPPYFMSRY